MTVNLFRRYNLIMRATFAGVLLIAGVLLFLEFQQRFDGEQALLETRVREHALALEFILKSTADSVDSLQLRAQTWFQEHPVPPPESPLYQSLIGEAKENFFTLDRPPTPYATSMIGNLTAPARPITPAFQLETEMALDLNSYFHTISKTIPNAAWIYYTSKSDFINIYPWVPSSDFRYVPALHEKEFYFGGLPEANPKHERFWTAAYVDEAGKGLMVTVSAPVIRDQQFMGTVSLDLTLDELNRFVRGWGGDYGQLFVINDRDQLLAHPSLVTSRDVEIQQLGNALPEAIRVKQARVMKAADGKLIQRGGHLIEAVRLEHAPYRLVFLAPVGGLVMQIVQDAVLSVAALLLGLTIMLLIANYATRREFIRPSQQLVTYIGQKVSGEAEGIPAVPAGWRPWFKTLRNVFNAHTQLISIRQELDVAQRMQRSILPERFPNSSDVHLYARMLPAKEVGGDFYDFFWLSPTRIGLVVADVSGKGVPAALFMAVARTLIRANAPSAAGPGGCLAATNEMLAAENEQAMFVTVFYGIFDTVTGILTYANGGHNPPCLVAPNGSVSLIPTTGGVALGVLEQMTYREKSLVLVPGSLVLLYTDGVTEAFDPAENEFTEARLIETLSGTQDLPVNGFVDHVVAAVQAFAAEAPQADDLTCLALKFEGHAPAEAV